MKILDVIGNKVILQVKNKNNDDEFNFLRFSSLQIIMDFGSKSNFFQMTGFNIEDAKILDEEYLNESEKNNVKW